MINRLSDSKFFSYANKKYNFEKSLAKVNWNNYIIPKDFIINKVKNFKSLKYPLVDSIISDVEKNILIPMDWTKSLDIKNTNIDLHLDYKLPNFMFNLNSINSDNKIITFADLSYKGKYMYDPTDKTTPTYYDINDLTFFHLMCAAYIQNKLASKPNISNNTEFNTKIADAYALIISKIIDNIFPIISTSSVDQNKLHFLAFVFCLENMFNVDKETACKLGMKSVFVVDKVGVKNATRYLVTDETFMDVDGVTKFPLDKFCEIICREFEYIDSKAFNADILSWKFCDRMTKNAIFALDSASAFINMIYLGEASIGIYNDLLIKKYIEMIHTGFINKITTIIKNS